MSARNERKERRRSGITWDRRWLARACALASLSGVLAGCPASDDEAPPGRLRDDLQVVAEFEAVDVGCLGEGCATFVSPVIQDVARDGDVVGVLYTYRRHVDAANFLEGVGIAVSQDGGSTWTQLASPPPTLNRNPYLTTRGLVVRGGKLYALTNVPRDEAIGDGGTSLAIDEYTLATGAWRSVGRLYPSRVFENGMHVYPPAAPEAPLTGTPPVHAYYWVGPSPQYVSSWSIYDIATGQPAWTIGETVAADASRYPGNCGPQEDWVGRFVGSTPDLMVGCFNDELFCQGFARLRVGADQTPYGAPSEWKAQFFCVSEQQWPVPSEARSAQKPYLAGPYLAGGKRQEPQGFYQLFVTAGETRAAWFVESAQATTVAPGTLAQLYGHSTTGRPRFADFVPVVSADGDQTRTSLYYGTEDRSFERAALPGSPCVDEQWCTYRPAIPEDSLVVLTVRDSTLQWVHPLGDDEYLAFYVVDRRPGEDRLQNAILVGRERGRP